MDPDRSMDMKDSGAAAGIASDPLVCKILCSGVSSHCTPAETFNTCWIDKHSKEKHPSSTRIQGGSLYTKQVHRSDDEPSARQSLSSIFFQIASTRRAGMRVGQSVTLKLPLVQYVKANL